MTPEHAALVAADALMTRLCRALGQDEKALELRVAVVDWAKEYAAALAAPALPGATPLDEQEHVRTLHEVREYLAILCGMRHWKRLDPADARAMAQAAQVIANEFAEHFSVALDPRGEEPGSD